MVTARRRSPSSCAVRSRTSSSRLWPSAFASSSSAIGSSTANSSPPRRADRVGPAQALEQHAGDPDDQLVAGVVAERVVDRLEVVDVEHQQRAAGAVARDLREVAADLELEAAAVEQAGQRVVVGHVLQLLLEALALRDVLDLGEQVVGAALGVAHDRDVHLHADRVAGGGDVALVALEGAGGSSSQDSQRPFGEQERSSGWVIASSEVASSASAS